MDTNQYCVKHVEPIRQDKQGKLYCPKCQKEKPVCTPINFLSPADRIRIENYQNKK